MNFSHKQVVLAVLDGWGEAPPSQSNAISLARKPNFDFFYENYPHTFLQASGEAVGLKTGEPGNSEAGHINLGAGRLVLQEKMWITETIHDGTFFQNPTLVSVVRHVLRNRSKLHLVGLLSDGQSAHSEPDHLEALLVLCKKMGLTDVFLHLFTDGRDSPPKDAANLIRKLEILLGNLGLGKVATIGGRYYGMDRGNNWERTGLAYETIVLGRGRRAFSAYEAVQDSYRRGVTDEFVLPTVVTSQNGTVSEKDGVVFFNLRSDRGRQLVKSFVEPRECDSATYECRLFRNFRNLHVVTLSDFGHDLPVHRAFVPPYIKNSLPHFLGKYPTMRQLYVAEREKFAHVTYFFHGGQARPEPRESRIRVPSAKVATFDECPEMSAREITESVVENMEKRIYNLIVVNYANADMLGHTGLVKPTVKAIEVLDTEMGKLARAAVATDSLFLITADHGNAEQMRDAVMKKIDTNHSTNLVPFILVGKDFEGKAIDCAPGEASLRDVAPTILDLLGMNKPPEMTGTSLLRKKI